MPAFEKARKESGNFSKRANLLFRSNFFSCFYFFFGKSKRLGQTKVKIYRWSYRFEKIFEILREFFADLKVSQQICWFLSCFLAIFGPSLSFIAFEF